MASWGDSKPRHRRRRPEGRCILCGKSIWAVSEMRPVSDNPGDGVRHVDCVPGGSPSVPGLRYRSGRRFGESHTYDPIEERNLEETESG